MMTKWLLEHYANPNISISNSGLTPLMLAAKFSYPECIVMLLKYEANINKIDVSILFQFFFLIKYIF